MSKMNKDELERIFYTQLETIESRGCPPKIIKHFLKMKEQVIEQASNLIPSEIDVPFCPVIPCFYGDCIVPGCISVDFLATMIRKRKIVGNKLFDVAGVNYFHSSEKITDNIQTPNRPYYIIGIRYNNRINTEKKEGLILKEVISLCCQSLTDQFQGLLAASSRYEEHKVPVVHTDYDDDNYLGLGIVLGSFTIGNYGLPSCLMRLF